MLQRGEDSSNGTIDAGILVTECNSTALCTQALEPRCAARADQAVHLESGRCHRFAHALDQALAACFGQIPHRRDLPGGRSEVSRVYLRLLSFPAC